MANTDFSRAQVDRLGERLRAEANSEDDLRLLDRYRRTFAPAYHAVVETAGQLLQIPVSGRPAKSTTSIIEKLRRESIRLSQMQDIAGCRVIVPRVHEQNTVVEAMKKAYPGCVVIDRRNQPSHGYRAVHVIPRVNGTAIEIQIRTSLQQVWAELSEKFADKIHPSIKYGGGPTEIRELLDKISGVVRDWEEVETRLSAVQFPHEDEIAKVRMRLSTIFSNFVKQLDRIKDS